MEYGKCCFKTEIKVKEIEFLFKKKKGNLINTKLRQVILKKKDK